jgi:predicted MFS family arabinose efflux permease
MASWSAGLGIGSVIPGLIRELRKPIRAFLAISAGIGLLTYLYSLSSLLLLSSAILFSIGIGVSFLVVVQTTVISKTPEFIRGRIFSINMFLHTATLPLSNGLMGLLANEYGVKTPIGLGGVIILLTSVASLLVRSKLAAASGEKSGDK